MVSEAAIAHSDIYLYSVHSNSPRQMDSSIIIYSFHGAVIILRTRSTDYKGNYFPPAKRRFGYFTVVYVICKYLSDIPPIVKYYLVIILGHNRAETSDKHEKM